MKAIELKQYGGLELRPPTSVLNSHAAEDAYVR